MIQQKACGLILVNRHNQILLLRNSRRGDWGLPKGHVENNESELETAYRELEEETGLTANDLYPVESKRHEIKYQPVQNNGARYEKIVVYRIAHLKKNTSITLSGEHDRYLWSARHVINTKIKFPELRKLIFKMLEDA